MNRFLRFVFYRVIVRFVVLIVLGLNVRHWDSLPQEGPAILVSNHNSHLDTMVLMTLLPSHLLSVSQPVAAADYFLRHKLLAWFALKIVGILPIRRKQENRDDDPLSACYEALSNNRILIFFPEGSRGEPEKLSQFRGGIAKLAEKYPHVPVIPILLHGLGKALPKGEALLVPFFCDVFIGQAMYGADNRKVFMRQLDQHMAQLASEGSFAPWE